jgi:hypothetical protein
MEDRETNLDHVIAPFFDTKILSDIRNDVLMQNPPSPYGFDTIYEPGVDIRPWLKVWHAMRAFLFRKIPLTRENTKDFGKLHMALQHKVDDFENKIRDTVFGATCRLYIWAKDSHQIWTTDRHEYALLYQTFGDLGVYYILHLTKKTIAFIDNADVMDQAIEELLRIDVPIYTELPWPMLNWQDRRNRLLGKSNADQENP